MFFILTTKNKIIPRIYYICNNVENIPFKKEFVLILKETHSTDPF